MAVLCINVLCVPCRTKGSNNTPEADEKKAFLDTSVLTLYPSVSGKLKELSKLPQRTDVNEWLATNSE